MMMIWPDISPVHTSNKRRSNIVECYKSNDCFDKVKCCFDKVACCFDIVAGVDGSFYTGEARPLKASLLDCVRTYVSVDDVADGRRRVVHRSSEERNERGVVHVYLVDLVEDLVDQTRVHHVLRLHRNHVFLKQFHVRLYSRCP